MPQMTDPLKALINLQYQIKNRGFQLDPCTIHKDIQVHIDHPNGEVRVTYAKVISGRVQAFVTYVPADPMDGVPCFSIGYAVPEKFRRQGLAAEIIEKSIDEMKVGFSRNGLRKFYIEAVIATSNSASLRTAEKMISATPDRVGRDHLSGEPVIMFMRLIEA